MFHLIALLGAILLWRYIRVFVFDTPEWPIYVSTDSRFDSLLYGCLLALVAWRGLSDRIFPEGPARYIVIAGAVTLLLVTFVLRDEAFRSTVRYSIQGIALMPLFHYAIMHPQSMLFRPLNWAPVRRIGIYSYTIYLSHFVIIHALEILGLDIENSITFAPVAAVLSIAWAAAVYKYIETPLRPLRARLTGHGGGSGAMQTKDQFAAP